MPIPDFVARLRAQVGTEQLWLSGVSGVILDDQDRVLLARRSDNGLWAVITGILDPGEQPAVALVREALEETGVAVEVLALTSVAAGDEVVYPNGDRARYLDVGFVCRAVGGLARVADDESTEVGWFAADALPSPLSATSAWWIELGLAHARALRSGTTLAPWFATAADHSR